MPIAATELARRLGAKAAWLDRADSQSLENLSLPKNATPTSLSFLSDPRLAHLVDNAGAVLVEEKYQDLVRRPFTVHRLSLAIARARQWLPLKFLSNSVAVEDRQGVHSTAIIDQGVLIGDATSVGANSVISGCVKIGSYCSIGPNVVISGPVSIGNRVRIEANTTIGAKPFMYVEDGCKWVEFPSFAGVQIRDGVDVGAGGTIDRGVTEDTVIGSDVKLDNQVHIGHGTNVGRDTVVAARVTVAGEATIGERCKIGGASAIGEGVSIGHDVTLAGMSAVTRSLPDAGAYAAAWPVQASSVWWRQLALLKRMVR